MSRGKDRITADDVGAWLVTDADGAQLIGDTVEELTAESTGEWLVTTQGTTHIWDMDNRTYERRPGPTTRAGAFEFDGAPQPITHVDIYPKVGGVARVWFDDPTDPYRELFRQSSAVARIERVR
ncbi:hypothetical protein [Mycolicibacter arupensis]|uniref:Uncharacterized protein n=1 Tax=Mycolicibacter arupensis TaxID=342002 RepID=A0A5C7Y202_9MYCO|nr:hypothetical protein [Mycolicibacter arupensis]TXI55651.1 MAG: hypothetical protein E6Q54_12250 [Mycolicibacter arupensis]